ncbi:SAM-dependent methyltransferase [Lichenifustis flavocetrariae]|uniref:Nodulation S family protein n=1 Tax=Lichenifustis flavocetrariae TaxID=2949735 RepID=A0AA42CJF6_9HYPH|nr:SAM-dependent methyltransferase [Lichenifustis flavocetrariae]MCW6509394.1 nodulation S family protein [Lichenifustis flavocetrariae]
MRDETLPLSHFEAFYARGGPDPWHFATSRYEAAKYDATLSALPRARYAKALEVGCSVGVFTARLAERCDDLLAIEPVAKALQAAQALNAARSWVRFSSAFIPADWPNERFDLVILSEVLDYLGSADLAKLAECLSGSIEPTGDVVMVHWVGKKGGAAKSTESSEILIKATKGFLRPSCQHRNSDYRLDVLHRDVSA